MHGWAFLSEEFSIRETVFINCALKTLPRFIILLHFSRQRIQKSNQF